MAFGLGFSDEEGGPKLTKSNLPTFEKGVALARMSKAFRDACLFSGMLLTEYLWIDTICINQNNDEETASEVRHMVDIYQHAVATISPRPQLEQRFQCGQVEWGRYDVLCTNSSTSKQLCLLKERLTATYSLSRIASIVDPQVFSNIEPYIQDSVTDLSDSEPLLVFHARLKTQPLLEQPPKPTDDVSLGHIEEPPVLEAQSEDTSYVAHATAAALLYINEAIVYFGRKNLLRAITKLVHARELIRTSSISSQSALQVDFQAAIYLARIFLIDGSTDVAMDLLDNLEACKGKCESPETSFATM